jgi:hypothetical protein
MERFWEEWQIADEIKGILDASADVVLPRSREEILDMAMGGVEDCFEVCYDVPGQGSVTEAIVSKCRNGLAINYTDIYMRRRDPDCMVIGDSEDTDKPLFEDEFGYGFSDLRTQTFAWLAGQKLAVICVMIGGRETGHYGILIAPQNAGFFIGGLADLQGLVTLKSLPKTFAPDAIIYLAPVFRHTHFDGKQIVVHNRLAHTHEIFSYNLYPGPSAKKGVYGILLSIGEREQWLTLHGSTVQAVTPYDNVTTILHEGASGGGKSEMLEYPHRHNDGRLLLGSNTATGENLYVNLNQSCLLRPVTDDMAISTLQHQKDNPKLVVKDAEQAWFIRLNHITSYGTDPYLEKLCIHTHDPLIFLNIDGAPGSTALIWEHIEDAPGKPCPNPRVILPRRLVQDAVDGPVEVDFRSFGIRAPACTANSPSYGIVGMLHVLPPALAWLWRLTSPRGDANPSITDSGGMVSEGVGSYWPFATGKYVNHANLLLEQIEQTMQTRHILIPNQHIGAWRVGFMPQWLVREYLARRGVARFMPEQLLPARCPLLGYVPQRMKIEGTLIPEYFFEVEKQPEVGCQTYDTGAGLLLDFFKMETRKYVKPDLGRLGRRIIQCCLDGGSLDDYQGLMPMTY